MQQQKLLELLIDYCNNKGSRTFSLKQINDYYKDYSIIGIGGKTPQATVRRLLQELRDENYLSFLLDKGRFLYIRWRKF